MSSGERKYRQDVGAIIRRSARLDGKARRMNRGWAVLLWAGLALGIAFGLSLWWANG